MDSEELATASKLLARLFASFPQSALADVDIQLRSYLEAVKDCDVRDIIAAVDRFRRGEMERASHQFCPSTAELCIEVRNRKIMREYAERGGKPVLIKA